MVFTKKAVAVVIGLALLPMIAVEAVFINTNFVFAKPAKANQSPMVLDSSNAPTISGGSAVVTDTKGVSWEYSGAANKTNYHVSLNHQGYFGIKSTTAWGYTKIEGITATFTGTGTSELWLLTSVDGITWHEQETLTSGTESTWANDWRFIRFYHYDDCGEGNTPGCVDIESVSISYGCTGGVSATEDIDSAFVGNVVSMTGLTKSVETVDISPNSIGGEAVRFTKSGSSSTKFTIKFNRSYTIGETRHKKVEFDIWTTRTNYKRTITLKGDSYTSGTINTDDHTSYRWTKIQGTTDWYHVEVPITAFANFVSGYYLTPEHKTGDGYAQDIPASGLANKVFNSIEINQGNCIIDNLRIGSSPCDPGIFNSATYKPKTGSLYWLKTSWVGVLFNDRCIITFSDNTFGTWIPTTDPDLYAKSPFYLRWGNKTGQVTVTVTVVCGYNRRTESTSRLITVQ